MSTSKIASRWRELSGENNWEGLLHPLDVDLRRYLIHYCQRAGAAGDAFNGTRASKGYAHSMYPADEFFARVGLENGNPYHYKVMSFIYAATAADEIAYFGYVAVATDQGKAVLGRRDILVSWRGTITNTEWGNDANIFQTSGKELFGNDFVQIHAGFYNTYMKTIANSPYVKTSARDQVCHAVQQLVTMYQNEDVSITVTGHSLGAALATLNAMDIAYNGFNKPAGNPNKSFMVTAFPAASPRVGNMFFKGVCDKLENFHILRIVNATDPVPKVPFLPGVYFHVGEELDIDTTKSPYLKWNISPHNLEAYQHAIAGQQENGEFKLIEELDFDNPVINKYTDGLLDEYKIPDNWWTKELFKNMVQTDDGHWKFNDISYVPDPPTA
ncbi:DAD1-like seeding establishment-related lipase [Hibiscus trionum]|uniref:Phospholipase A1 n=1 Tax=Hibiscus trionum TaxID=183268 RepID=A0A9W7LV27_HIBTR|nr:DAD1-like seeding establishment-related lipase [Hibiscus trionum]